MHYQSDATRSSMNLVIIHLPDTPHSKAKLLLVYLHYQNKQTPPADNLSIRPRILHPSNPTSHIDMPLIPTSSPTQTEREHEEIIKEKIILELSQENPNIGSSEPTRFGPIKHVPSPVRSKTDPQLPVPQSRETKKCQHL